jgi:hypothetical protein
VATVPQEEAAEPESAAIPDSHLADVPEEKEETVMLALPSPVSVPALPAGEPVTSTVVTAVPKLHKMSLEELEASAPEAPAAEAEPASDGIAAGQEIDYVVPAAAENTAETRMTGTVTEPKARTVTEIVDMGRDLLFCARGDMEGDEILAMECSADDDSSVPDDSLDGYVKPAPKAAPKTAAPAAPKQRSAKRFWGVSNPEEYFAPKPAYRFNGDLRSLRN